MWEFVLHEQLVHSVMCFRLWVSVLRSISWYADHADCFRLHETSSACENAASIPAPPMQRGAKGGNLSSTGGRVVVYYFFFSQLLATDGQSFSQPLCMTNTLACQVMYCCLIVGTSLQTPAEPTLNPAHKRRALTFTKHASAAPQLCLPKLFCLNCFC